MKSSFDFLEKNEAVLLIVDLQEAFLKLCLQGDKVKTNIKALIDTAKILSIPIIFSEQNSGKLGKTLHEIIEKAPDAPVFNKMEFGCFENEILREAIQRTLRKTLILAGIEAHICVFQTGYQALKLGYDVHVAADAVSSPKALDWKIGIRCLETAGAHIETSEMIIYGLLKRADSVEFRKALPILKKLL
jgi:nicotinamidase-related amidase